LSPLIKPSDGLNVFSSLQRKYPNSLHICQQVARCLIGGTGSAWGCMGQPMATGTVEGTFVLGGFEKIQQSFQKVTNKKNFFYNFFLFLK
jgi:hypothetical protein